uniref:Uncharacterized protein n=2 Tax=Ceratitis capitata TaxID=7213 RepID=W8AU48_CERCA
MEAKQQQRSGNMRIQTDMSFHTNSNTIGSATQLTHTRTRTPHPHSALHAIYAAALPKLMPTAATVPIYMTTLPPTTTTSAAPTLTAVNKDSVTNFHTNPPIRIGVDASPESPVLLTNIHPVYKPDKEGGEPESVSSESFTNTETTPEAATTIVAQQDFTARTANEENDNA